MLQSLVGRELTLGGEGRETHYEDSRICMFVGFLALHKAYVPRLGSSTRSLTFGPQVVAQAQMTTDLYWRIQNALFLGELWMIRNQ